jgi:hypothetical protein
VSDKLGNYSDSELLNYVKEAGGQRAAARKLGVPRTTLQYRVWQAQEAIRKDRAIRAPLVEPRPKKGVQRFIFSSAQDNTGLDTRCKNFLRNLEAYAKSENASIHIAGFTYQKGLFEDHSKESGVYTLAVQPYLMQARMEIDNRIAFCGEMNILPTAVRPLSGLDTYTRHMDGIIPHPKIALESVPTPKHQRAKQIMTTGCVTPANYVPKKAGLKAQFHHVIGALLVEIDANGKCFTRHLLADGKGNFQDLTKKVEDGVVTDGHRVHAINWGDIHIEKMDPISYSTCWGLIPRYDEHGNEVDMCDWEVDQSGRSMLDVLRPEYQFFHDTSDFSPRNHHNVNDPHFRFKMFADGNDSVEDALRKAATFLSRTTRGDTESVVVESNHDLAYLKWLRTNDYRSDPVNALFFLRSQLEVYRAIDRGDSDFSIFEWAMHDLAPKAGTLACTFLREDDSFIILGDQNTGIECAMHGHLGANGGRPSPTAFARMGPKLNIGHVHSPYIRDGVYAAGLEGLLDQGYNKGASGWCQTEIITYGNGRRTLVTRDGPDWRAVG